MYIKIYTKSQLILLRNLMPVFKKKYILPRGIFDKVEAVLELKNLERQVSLRYYWNLLKVVMM